MDDLTPPDVVGRRVAALRERRGMSQAMFGRELGPLLGKPWPRQTVSVAENGGRAFTVTELVAIAHVLDCGVSDLLVALVDTDVTMPTGATVNVLPRETGARSGAVMAAAEAALTEAIHRLRERQARDEAILADLRAVHERIGGAA